MAIADCTEELVSIQVPVLLHITAILGVIMVVQELIDSGHLLGIIVVELVPAAGELGHLRQSSLGIDLGERSKCQL